MAGRNASQQRSDERIVGASEYQNVGLLGRVLQCLAEIDVGNLLGYGMFDPPLFNQGHEKRTRFFVGCQTVLLQSVAVSVAAHGRLGCNHNGRMALAYFSCHGGAGFDHSYHRHVGGLLNARKCQRGCGVAGDYEQVDGIYFQFAIQRGEAGSEESTAYTVEKIEVNLPLDDSLFALPATKTAAKPASTK